MLRKSFSFLLVLIFVPLVFALILLFSLKTSLIKPDFFTQSFEKNNLFDVVIEQGAQYLSSGIGVEGGMKVGKLNQEEFSTLIKQSLSPEWLKTQTNNTFKEIFSYVNKEKETIEYMVPISELKSSFAKNLSSNNKELESQLSQLPDQYDLGAYLMKKNSLNGLREFYTMGNKLMTIFSSLLIFIVILLLLINRKNIRGALKWIIIPVLIPSLLILIIALLGKMAIIFISSGLLAGFPAQAKEIAKVVINSTGGELLNYLAVISGSITLSAILVLIGIKISNLKKLKPSSDL